MPRIAPFVGLRYDPAVAGPLDALVAPPYDVLGDAALSERFARSPFNSSRLERGASGGTEAEYREAAALLAGWRATGVLVETEPSLVAYEMRFRLAGVERRVRGVLGAVDVEPWGGSILPHERTMRGPVEDRMRLLRIVRANLSPVHGILPGPSPVLATTLDAICARPADAAASDADIEHSAWWFTPPTTLLEEVAGQRCMIADGHHRYTTALAFREEMRAAVGPGPWDGVMMLLVDATEEPPVLPFHRLVDAPPAPIGGTPARDLDAILAAADDDACVVGRITRGADGPTYELVPLRGAPPAVTALEPLLPSDESAVRFTQDAAEAERSVASGETHVAWILPPTTAERIRSVIDRGDRLPRKSTYFWPKPLTGFVIRPLD